MTRLATVHQFHPVIAYGDAVSNDCLELQRLFWASDIRSDLFAEEAKPEVAALVRDWRDLERLPKDALLLIHHSMGNDVIEEVMKLPQRKAVIYHNITPAENFAGINEHAMRYSELGRAQLARLANVCEFGLGDSEFNRAELAEAGFAKTAVVPILYDWEAFDVEPDRDVARALADERTNIVVVGQLLPHKRTVEAVSAFARYRRRDPAARLFIVGSSAMSGPYLEQVMERIGDEGLEDAVTVTGSVTTEQLVAYYRGATALLALSSHEGFGVPLIEAMRSELPIVGNRRVGPLRCRYHVPQERLRCLYRDAARSGPHRRQAAGFQPHGGIFDRLADFVLIGRAWQCPRHRGKRPSRSWRHNRGDHAPGESQRIGKAARLTDRRKRRG